LNLAFVRFRRQFCVSTPAPIRHPFDKGFDSAFKTFAVGFGKAEKRSSNSPICELCVKSKYADLLLVLPENRVLRVLENGVGNWIIERDFFLISFRARLLIFRFPITERRIFVANGAIDFLAPVFCRPDILHKQITALIADFFEQSPKSAPRLRFGNVTFFFETSEAG
jgi:hypothetical protein